MRPHIKFILQLPVVTEIEKSEVRLFFAKSIARQCRAQTSDLKTPSCTLWNILNNFQDFSEEMKEEEQSYDLIISNPPFYNDNFETNDTSRNTARFTSALSFKDLLKGTSKILSDSGVFIIIIPFKEEIAFVSLAEKYRLFLIDVVVYGFL